ncbi:hypothetical protein FJZ31_06045 [Candidatus Poribacteria bacterium]|nr:hypothetical protein [Candidatus Poribacteria bacterium]
MEIPVAFLLKFPVFYDMRLDKIPHDRVWFIPVLFSGEIPKWRIGAGETLHSIQWVELSPQNWDDGIQRIIGVVSTGSGRRLSEAKNLSENRSHRKIFRFAQDDKN